jgi:hypothetical protein
MKATRTGKTAAEVDTFEKLIERLYSDEVAALRAACADGFRPDYQQLMRGQADGLSRARKLIEALREAGYVIGC